MKTKNKNKKNRKPKSRSWGRIAAAFIIAAVCLSVGVLVYRSDTKSGSLESGQLNAGETHPGEALRQSLDLRVAAKADYPSSALSVHKDLGIVDGLKEQVIRFEVPADSLSEYALLIEPSSAPPAGGFPALILCHGYVSPAKYETTQEYIGDMQLYARNGFAVIKPDFRGQGDSLNSGQPNSAYFSMDYNTDIMSLISAIKQTKYINPADINLWGHSMGAYIALRASVLSHDIKDTILLSGPVSSLNHMYLDYVPPSDENNPIALKTRSTVFSKYGTPGENTSFWKNASPTNFLTNTAVKYQIHVGALDPVVPPVFSAQLNDDLSALKRSHEYFVYDQGRHGLELQRSLIWARSLALLKSNNP